MRLHKGFRLPEPVDHAIQWPTEKTQLPLIAVYSHACSAWLVTGHVTAFGSAINLVTQFGNDWYAVMIEPVPEAHRD